MIISNNILNIDRISIEEISSIGIFNNGIWKRNSKSILLIELIISILLNSMDNIPLIINSLKTKFIINGYY